MDNQNLDNFDLEPPKKNNIEEESKPAKAKSPKKFEFNLKALIFAIVGIILAAIIALGVYSAVNKQSPVSAVKSIFTSDEKEIIGNWQMIGDDDSQDSDVATGVQSLVFRDDGTCDRYLWTYNLGGKYSIDGNVITITKNKLTIQYKFKVNKDKLTLTVMQNGKVSKDKSSVSVYEKVDELNQKSLTDTLQALKGSTSNTEQ